MGMFSLPLQPLKRSCFFLAFFSQTVPHEGQLYFQFVTSYSGEHQYLEEFQMHRRIFGVG